MIIQTESPGHINMCHKIYTSNAENIARRMLKTAKITNVVAKRADDHPKFLDFKKSFVSTFLSKRAKFGAEKTHIVGKFRNKIEIRSTQFADVHG